MLFSNKYIKSCFFFPFISCAYMSGWTFTGSLISYFKLIGGTQLYVQIYCAFFFPGIFVSTIMYFFDRQFDAKFGSYRACYLRGTMSLFFVIVFLIVALFINAHRIILTVTMVCIGIFSWICHGNACRVGLVHSKNSIKMLLVGLRLPSVFAGIVVLVFNANNLSTEKSIKVLFLVAVCLAIIGAKCWVILFHQPDIIVVLEAKDHKKTVQEIVQEIGNENFDCKSEWLMSLKASGFNEKSVDFSEISENISTEDHASIEESTSLLSPSPLSNNYGQTLSKNECNLIAESIKILRLVTFVNTSSSLFLAAVVVYIDSSKQLNFSEGLFFIRLFADFLGRIMAFLPRPSLLHGQQPLLLLVLSKLIILLYVIMYAFAPIFPDEDSIIAVAVFSHSIMSGYINLLAFESVSFTLHSKHALAFGATLMNLAFQFGGFLAAVLGLLISTSAENSY